MSKPWITLALGLALAACAAPTPYGPVGEPYVGHVAKGYADEQVAADRYRVSFAGNWVTSLATVEDYVYYRAAQVTLQSGHDYFRVVERELEHRVIHNAMADFFPGYGFGLTGYIVVYPGHTFAVAATIEVAHGQAPADEANVFDARRVLRDLAPRIGPSGGRSL